MNDIDKYIEYHRNNSLNWEVDTHLDAAVYFADKWKLDSEQRCWLSFLTTICETTPTSIYLFRHFPDVRTTDAKELELFTKQHKGAMAFQYDVRWILYEINRVVSSYKLLVKEGQLTTINKISNGDNPRERHEAIVRNFNVPRFGPYVFMLYTELINHLCGISLEAKLDPRTNHSVRSGLIHASGFGDFMHCTKSGSRPTEAECSLLNISLREIIERVQNLDINPRHKTVWAIETTLCTYNKTLHGRRYLGFYKERQRKEIERLSSYTQSIGENFDWSELWEYHKNWGNWGNIYNS